MGISEYSWYWDQQIQPLGSHHRVSRNGGQEDEGQTRQGTTDAASRGLRDNTENLSVWQVRKLKLRGVKSLNQYNEMVN